MVEDDAGVDHTRILQQTFVVTVVIGAPALAIGSLFVDLPTWSARAAYAGTFGGSLWLGTALALYLRDWRRVRQRRARAGQ